MADLGLIAQDGRAATRRVLRRILKVVGAVLAVPVLLIVILESSVWYAVHETAAVPLDPANWRAAAPDLVKLCQTDPALLRQLHGAVDADQVPSVGKLHPEAGLIDVRPDGADVGWGGGFYGAHWRLERSRDEDEHAATHTWTLTFWDDGDSRGHVLETFTMPSDARFTQAELSRPR